MQRWSSTWQDYTPLLLRSLLSQRESPSVRTEVDCISVDGSMWRGSSHHTWWSEFNCQDPHDGEGCFHSCPLCSDLHKHTKGLRCIMLAQQRQLVSHSLDQCVKTFLNLKASDEHHTPWCRLKTFSLKLEGLPSPLLFMMTDIYRSEHVT